MTNAGGRIAGIAVAVAAGWALIPAAASAGLARYGDLELAYPVQTNSGGMAPPSRYEHTTYDPCGDNHSAGLALVSGGGRVYDSDLDPMVTPFKIGQAWMVSLSPIGQIPPAGPDSYRQVVDNRSQNGSLSRGDVAVCGDVSSRSYVSNDQRTAKRGRTTVKAACPDSKHVLGGGGVASGPFLSQRMVAGAPFDSGDAGKKPDDGWRIAVDNLSGKRRKATAHAICAPQSGLSYVAKAFKAPKRTRKHAEVQCPAGEYVIGGGVSHDAKARKVGLVASYFDADLTHDHWYVDIDNLSRKRFGGRVHAICHS